MIRGGGLGYHGQVVLRHPDVYKGAPVAVASTPWAGARSVSVGHGVSLCRAGRRGGGLSRGRLLCLKGRAPDVLQKGAPDYGGAPETLGGSLSI